MSSQEIRIALLKRLAEQAMSDAAFRAEARENLDAALAANGYRLNAAELDLVHQFRDALANAGVDLSLAAELTLDLDDDLSTDDIEQLQAMLREQTAER
jgi:hypothetical protein